jgi:hypothetical protein
VHGGLSSDGRALDVVDDMVECGVSFHDPQLRRNTLAGIRRAYRGMLCASVDLDQQGFPFMSPEAIRAQVREVVETLGAPEGGLMLSACIDDPQVSLQNIAALVEAMEEYCFP